MAPQIDDGAQLRKMLTDAGISVQRFSELMGKSKNTPNNWFNSLTLPDATILAAAKALRMDAGEYFPRLKGKVSQPLPNSSPAGLGSFTQEVLAPYGTQIPSLLPDCQRQLAATQQKLIETLEQYNKLLVEHNQVLRNMARPTVGGGAGVSITQPLHNAYVNP